MKKIVLLFSAVIMSMNVQADWQQLLAESWDNAKSQGQALYSEFSKDELSDLPPARKIAIKSWDKVEDRFNDILEVKLDKFLAPESAWLKKTQAQYQRDIDEILNDVYAILNDQLLEDARQDITVIEQLIEDKRKQAAEQKSKAVILIGSDKQDALDQHLSYENEIREYNMIRENLLTAVQDRLSEFGSDLSLAQVEALLVRVNSDDILGVTTVFPVIGEIAKTYAEITASSAEDINNAKKYYSMYVVLLELQLHIQERYIDGLKSLYIPRIDDLREKQQSLIITTQKEQLNALEKHRNMYALNLKSQHTTLDAIALYKDNLKKDLTNMSRAHALLFEDYKVAVNTLNTVTMSSQVLNSINDSNQLFDKIMALQAPELVPFNNMQMQKEFSILTEKIR
ncbi:hypothetical protein [Psychromonas sp.]|uniref:hypothetical protein n=1 Tax=Psychromonas sp. TaxID=1884585 RepID=UPI0035665EC5